MSLDSIAPDGEVDILPDFPALVEGRSVWVTAVLDRTAVIEPAPGEPKQLVRRSGCLVDPTDLRFSAVTARDSARRGREAARRSRRSSGQNAA
ncbi:MAG: hypothetical protein M3024_05515 [Candidatus Dormibacteraeota bacterium]|nr:hypothetical protein [Candidatus Dormibacteraeota bacterium]